MEKAAAASINYYSCTKNMFPHKMGENTVLDILTFQKVFYSRTAAVAWNEFDPKGRQHENL